MGGCRESCCLGGACGILAPSRVLNKALRNLQQRQYCLVLGFLHLQHKALECRVEGGQGDVGGCLALCHPQRPQSVGPGRGPVPARAVAHARPGGPEAGQEGLLRFRPWPPSLPRIPLCPAGDEADPHPHPPKLHPGAGPRSGELIPSCPTCVTCVFLHKFSYLKPGTLKQGHLAFELVKWVTWC